MKKRDGKVRERNGETKRNDKKVNEEGACMPEGRWKEMVKLRGENCEAVGKSNCETTVGKVEACIAGGSGGGGNATVRKGNAKTVWEVDAWTAAVNY